MEKEKKDDLKNVNKEEFNGILKEIINVPPPPRKKVKQKKKP